MVVFTWKKEILLGIFILDFIHCSVPSEGDNHNAYFELKKIHAEVTVKCGMVCNTKVTGPKGKYYDAIWKDIQCENIYDSKLFDKPSGFFRSPRKIPNFMLNDFLYDGRVELDKSLFLDESNGPKHVLHWTNETIENLRQSWRTQTHKFLYTKQDNQNIFNYLKDRVNVQDKHVLIVGTQIPWIEALALEAGAAKTTSFDYFPIQSDHPQALTISVNEFAERYLNGTLDTYDVVVTFSSLEHSGLGRYGDSLNPWGDLITMARLWCAIKPGSKMVIGVPTGSDKLFFNGFRRYGPLHYSHLFANWIQDFTVANTNFNDPGCSHCYQPLHILTRPLTKEDFYEQNRVKLEL